MKWIACLVIAACGSRSSDPAPAGGSATPRPAPPDASAAPADAAVPASPPQLVTAPPGGKIVRIAATPANDAALTVDDANEVRLWPALDGSRLPLAVELPPANVLALQHAGSDFAALLGTISGTLVVRIDATGKRTAVAELPPIDGALALDAGFVTWRGKHVEWLDVAGAVTRASDTEPKPTVPKPLVTAKDSDLVIGGRYLGYAFPLLSAPLGTDPRHLVVPGPGNRWLQISAELTPVGELVPATPNKEVASKMTYVGDRDWLVDVPSGVVLWTEGAASGVPVMAKANVVEVDLESHLVLFDDKRLARYVPGKHTLEPIAFTPGGDPTSQIHLVSPSVNHGAVLVITLFSRDNIGEHGVARYIHDIEHPERGEMTWHGDNEWPLAVTSGGALLINHQAAHWAIVVDGKSEGDIPTDIAPSRDRKTYLKARGPDIELVERGGKVLWTTPKHGAGPSWDTSAAWIGDRVWMVSPHGVALLDTKTGAPVRVASGWGFELSSSPHPPSTIGRPLAVELATGRDGPLAPAADTTFQKLAREVADQSKTAILWWGPVRFEDKQVRRAAFLQSPDINGTALFAILVEIKPGTLVAVTAQSGGFPDFQGPFSDADPTWGTIHLADDTPVASTLDAAPFTIGSKWIHMSYEKVTFTLERDRVVVVSDNWLERENTGNAEHRFAETGDSKAFDPGNRPLLAKFKGHATRFAVSAPSSSAAQLASGIHEQPE